MKRSTLATSVAAFFCLGVGIPLLAAQTPAPVPGTVNHQPPGSQNVATTKPAEMCLADLRAFDSQMEKDGYWLGGTGYGYGYRMGGYRGAIASGYQDARPGYEVRTLIASATILARNGQQQPCEDALATARKIYTPYVADLHGGGVPMEDMSGWRQQQIAAAQPVAGQNIAFRSDELLGTAVRSTQNEALGSVDDLVLSPQTGKIAYLVIGRGGFFGIDEKYVPVPWENFKLTPNAKLLVLDTTKATMDAAPEVNHDQYTTLSQFQQQSQKVDSYWKSHITNKGVN
jgi:sporulation protein YlmC with PRC-barrel domain